MFAIKNVPVLSQKEGDLVLINILLFPFCSFVGKDSFESFYDIIHKFISIYKADLDDT